MKYIPKRKNREWSKEEKYKFVYMVISGEKSTLAVGKEFNICVANVFKSFNNLNYWLKRVKPYNPKGRLQTEKESNDLIPKLKQILSLISKIAQHKKSLAVSDDGTSGKAKTQKTTKKKKKTTQHY